MRILTLSQLSLAGSSGIAEVKQPIWFADGTSASTTDVNYAMLADGSATITNYGTTYPNNTISSQYKLVTISSNIPPSLKFAFEATIWNSSASYTTVVYLIDVTNSTGSIAATITTSATSASVVRSSQINLVPGHTYCVSPTTSNASGTAYITDASLIIFP